MTISIIAALSKNRVIGLNNRLPWRLSADLKRFRELTMGHSLVMGRKTFESIGRPLPGRRMIVITRQEDYAYPSVFVAHSVFEGIRMARGDEVFIAGGAQVYQQTLTMADRLYLTLIDASFHGDAYFPEFNKSDWHLLLEERFDPTIGEPYRFAFLVYERCHTRNLLPNGSE